MPEGGYSQSPSIVKTPTSLRAAQIVIGVITLALAGMVIAFPSFAALVVAAWLSVSLMFGGIESAAIGAAAPSLPRGVRVVSMILGAASIAASILVLVYPGSAVYAALILLSIGLVFLGSSSIARGTSHRHMPGWTKAMLIAVGSMTLVSSFLIMAFPLLGVPVLFTLVAVALIINGASYTAAGVSGVMFKVKYHPRPRNDAKEKPGESEAV